MDLTGIRRQDAWQAPAQLEEGRRAKAQLEEGCRAKAQLTLTQHNVRSHVFSWWSAALKFHDFGNVKP